MVDKITAVPKANPEPRVGRLSDDDLVRLNRAAVVFLGLVEARPPPCRRPKPSDPATGQTVLSTAP